MKTLITNWIQRQHPALLREIAGGFLLALAACVLAGCASTPRPAPDRLASIEVRCESLQDVALLTTAVFRDAGWTPVLPAGPRMVFERKGSTWNTIVHGDWSDGKIWYRARVDIRPTPEGTCIVGCNAWRVIDKGDAHFEEERKLGRTGHGEFQELLNQVRDRVLSAPTDLSLQ